MTPSVSENTRSFGNRRIVNPQPPDVCVAFPVPRGGLGLLVNLSVQFEDQPQLPAAEVRDEGIDRELAPEFQSAQAPVSEEPPHHPLGGRLPPSEVAGEIAQPVLPIFVPGLRDELYHGARGV